MTNLIRDYRRDGKYAELRKLVAIGSQLANALSSGTMSQEQCDDLSGAWFSQLMKMRATDEKSNMANDNYDIDRITDSWGPSA